MKTHTTIGADMLLELGRHHAGNALMEYAYQIVRWHHERWDGRGYPDGLKGDDIPIAAQVVSVADVYDALTSVRVYKDAIPHEEAIQMIWTVSAVPLTRCCSTACSRCKTKLPRRWHARRRRRVSHDLV